MWYVLGHIACNQYSLVWGIDVSNITAELPANERRRYFVTTSLIGWAQAYKQPCHRIPVDQLQKPALSG